MWTEQFRDLLYLVLMGALLRFSYELSALRAVGSNPSPQSPEEVEFAALSPQMREWARKATVRYAEAQGKKWRRWSEVMFS